MLATTVRHTGAVVQVVETGHQKHHVGLVVLDPRLDVGHLVGQPRAAERVVVVSHPRDMRQRDRSSHPRPGPHKLHSSVLALELVPQAPAPRVVPCELVADRVAGDHQPERTERCVVVRRHGRAGLRAHGTAGLLGVTGSDGTVVVSLGTGSVPGRPGAPWADEGAGVVGVATVSAETVAPEAPVLGRTTAPATTAAMAVARQDGTGAADTGGAREQTLHRSTIRSERGPQRSRTTESRSICRTDPSRSGRTVVPSTGPHQPAGSGRPSAKPAADWMPTTARSCELRRGRARRRRCRRSGRPEQISSIRSSTPGRAGSRYIREEEMPSS